MQDLFLKLRAAEGFHTASNETAYAVRVATNLAFQWRRSQQRRSARELAHDQRSDETTAHAILEKQEEYELTLDALGQLSDLMREVIVLSRLEGHSNESVAEQIGKTPHQVRALISKATGQLREALNPSRGANTP